MYHQSQANPHFHVEALLARISMHFIRKHSYMEDAGYGHQPIVKSHC